MDKKEPGFIKSRFVEIRYCLPGKKRRVDRTKTVRALRFTRRSFEEAATFQPLFFDVDEYNFLINDVKFTFFYYPCPIEHPEYFLDVISLP
jgi:hypothetical protein